MATPNTSISPLGLSDVNVELNYPSTTPRNFDDGIFRSLTGQSGRQVLQTTINISDLSNKTAFGGIISANSSNVTSYGVIEREINLLANTDMFVCDVAWTANLISGAAGTLTTNGKQASYKVVGVQEANVTSNVQITATLSYQGHVIGTAQKYVSFTINSLPPTLFVNGNTVAESVKFEPTSISTTLVATANAPGATMSFTVVPNDAGVLISGNTVTLLAQAGQAGTDNNRSYSVLTELFFNNQIIAQDLKNVNVRAFYAVPDVIMTVPATTNNMFAISGSVFSSLTLSGSHNVPGANLTWTATKVSGDDSTLTVAANRGSANLYLNVPSGTFGTKKSIYDVVTTLAYANGQFITSRTNRLTLRAGAYGLSVVTDEANVSGYTAQTAVTTVSVNYLAGTLSWNIARVSGDVAAVSNTVSGSSGTATIILNTDAVGVKSASYRVNPVLTFDGVIMANLAITTLTQARQNAYTFALSGPTTNNQVGAAPVAASLATTASHNIAGGTVTFSKPSGPSVLTSTALVGTTTYTNNTIGSDSFTLSATLRDEQGRVVETKSVSQLLRAYAPNMTFVGANTFSQTGFSDQAVSMSANAVLGVAGANSMNVTATLLVGSSLTFAASGNSTLQTMTLSANRTTIGTTEGTYRMTATVNYFGQLYSRTWDATLSVTKDDAQFAINGTGQNLTSFNFPVVANGDVTVSHVIPNGTVTWGRSGSGTVTDVPIQNNTQLRFRTVQPTVGSASANQTVTATLRDAGGAFVDQKSVVVTTAATVSNPALVLNGPVSNVVTNTFNASASVTVTPSVSSALTGHTFQFSSAATSGSAAVSSNSSAVLLTNSFDGAGEARGAYNVTCNVVLNGQTIATSTKAITVAAVCPAPTLNSSGTNNSAGSFNFPVSSWGWMDVSSSPAGATFNWSWNLVAGAAASNIYTENSNGRLVIQNNQSDVGGRTSTYDVTCTYRTPNGTSLGSRTLRVSTYSERYNPNIALNYTNGNSATASGFGERLDAIVGLQASVNPGLSGHTYRISYAWVGGNFNNVSFTADQNSGYMAADLFNLVSQHGTNQKTAQYDFYVDVVLNGQVISGAASARTYHTINPGSVSGVGDIEVFRQVWSGTASASFSFNPDGTCYITGGNRTWMSPSNPGEAANYEVSTNGGASYAPLTSPQGVSVSVTGTAQKPGNQIRSGTYIVRNRWTGSWVGSGTYYLDVGAGTPV